MLKCHEVDSLTYRLYKGIKILGIDGTTAYKYAEIIKRVASSENLDPFLLVALIYQESTFNQYAKGKAGEIGACQIMPYWAENFGYTPEQLWDLEVNITVAAKILKHNLDRYKTTFKAVKAYNGYNRKGHRYATKLLKRRSLVLKHALL